VARRVAILLAAAGIAAALFFVLRPKGEDESAPAQPQPATTAAPAETASEPEPKPKPKIPTLNVRVRDGRVVGGVQRLTVERGSRVRIVVRSDVRDHVHVHGYDLMRDVGPGRPARIDFRATIPGRFEIELEDRKLPIAELEVRP
jgi:pyruvate/2-oxoglutarate dehydrogenase complex dihydrolipoamide acyltransferase (E2) component